MRNIPAWSLCLSVGPGRPAPARAFLLLSPIAFSNTKFVAHYSRSERRGVPVFLPRSPPFFFFNPQVFEDTKISRKCEDLTGRRFGKWYVIGRAENRKDGSAQWTCRCDCGTIRVITGSPLRNGRTIKCAFCGGRNGWLLSARQITEGQRYGSLITKKYVGNKPIKWECVCACGRTLTVIGYHLVSGHSTKCRSCSVRVRHVASDYHSLTDINHEKMTATCKKCGRVPIRFNGDIAKCYVASVHGRVHHPDEALELLESQDGKCANPGCPNPLVFNNGTGKSACLDHDHVTRFIRRWFCCPCNSAFGYTRECAAVLRGLATLASDQEFAMAAAA